MKLNETIFPNLIKTKELIEKLINHPKSIFSSQFPKTILLSGPSSIGKTFLINTIFFNTEYKFIVISHRSQLNEELFKQFQEIKETILIKKEKIVLFIDNIDKFVIKNKNLLISKKIDQFLSFLDDLISLSNHPNSSEIFIISACTNIKDIHDIFDVKKRFSIIHPIAYPNYKERKETIKLILSDLDISNYFEQTLDIAYISSQTSNYSNGCLICLFKDCITKRLLNLKSINTLDNKIDLKDIISNLQLKFNLNFNSVNEVTCIKMLSDEDKIKLWEENIVGLKEIKIKLKQYVELPLLFPDKLLSLGIQPFKGVLLYGPPGCGKTSLVKMMASITQTPLFILCAAQIYSSFVGESEKIIRDIFQKANQVKPSIIFIDEIDTLIGNRSINFENHDNVQEKILSTLLNEMDGIVESTGLMILAATNRLDILDPALRRPGRFDRHIYVGPPDSLTRLKIFQRYLKNIPIEDQDFLNYLVKMTTNYSSSDIQNICREASFNAIKEASNSLIVGNNDIDEIKISNESFVNALKSCRSSLDRAESHINK